MRKNTNRMPVRIAAGTVGPTIIHGVKNITNRLDVDPELKQNLEEILDELGCSAGDMVDGNM